MPAWLTHCAVRILPAILGALVVAGCGPQAREEVDFGTLTNSVYENVFFGLSVNLPSDWSVQDQATQQQLTKVGGELAAGDNPQLKSVVKASELQTVNLFAAFQHPVARPVEFNPSIIGVAERIRDYPDIKRGNDYLHLTRKIIVASQVNAAFPKPYYVETLAGQEFDVMEVEIPAPNKPIKQKYLVSLRKGYALTFIATYRDDSEAAALQEILRTVKFK